jgi:hypothetical protein
MLHKDLERIQIVLQKMEKYEFENNQGVPKNALIVHCADEGLDLFDLDFNFFLLGLLRFREGDF